MSTGGRLVVKIGQKLVNVVFEYPLDEFRTKEDTKKPLLSYIGAVLGVPQERCKIFS